MKDLKYLILLFLIQNTFAQAPIIGTNFVGNNMTDGSPMDNDLAISNGGYILSTENTAYNCYKSDGAFLAPRYTHAQFYQNRGTPSLTVERLSFDPRCVYDRYNDRFIIVALTMDTNTTKSKLLVSFSKTNRPDSMYWHYEISVDSVYPRTTAGNLWFDHPNIAINKDELFIAVTSFNASNEFKNNAIFQIRKLDGYSGLTLTKRILKDVKNTEGELFYNIVPVQDALQSDTYNDTMFFIANKAGYSNNYYWWQLNSTLNDAPSPLIKRVSVSDSIYRDIPYISQPGGLVSDRITKDDCRVKSAYFQNNRIIFTFHTANIGGGALIRLARINVLNNTNIHNDLKVVESTNFCFPSIASYSYVPTEYKSLLAFQRVGVLPNDYVSLWVVALDENRVWSVKQEVKRGLGLVNVFPLPDQERLGDYIKIQPKYDATDGECWMTGSYAFGSTPNLHGNINDYNAYIAQVFPPYTTSVEEVQNKALNSYLIYPNPTNSILNVQSKTGLETPFEYSIFDLSGKLILQGTSTSQIEVNTLQQGLYHLQLRSKTTTLESYKLMKY